jgi:hypothetical protein
MGATNESGVGVEGMVVVPREGGTVDSAYSTCAHHEVRGQKAAASTTSHPDEADLQYRYENQIKIFGLILYYYLGF